MKRNRMRLFLVVLMVLFLVSCRSVVEQVGDEANDSSDLELDGDSGEIDSGEVDEAMNLETVVDSLSRLEGPVTIEGDYELISTLNDFLREYGVVGLRKIGETSENYYFTTYDEMGDGLIFRTDKALDKFEILIELKDYEQFAYEIIEDSNKYGQLIFRKKEKLGYLVYDESFNFIEEISLPEQWVSNSKEYYLRHWIMDDEFETLIYTIDEIGLDVMNIVTLDVIHIANTLNAENELEVVVNGWPSLLMDGRYINCSRYGYEWTDGYVLYDTLTGEMTELNGAFDFTYDGSLGCYIYYDDGMRATVFDYEKNQRKIRGLYGGFVDSSYDGGFNVMVGDYVFSGKMDFEAGVYRIVETYLETGLVTPVVDIKFKSDIYYDLPVVMKEGEYLYLLVPIEDYQQMIRIKHQEIDWNQFYAFDMVMFSDGMVEIKGDKIGYSNENLSPLLEEISEKQIEQMMYRSVLMYDLLFDYELTTAMNLASKELVQEYLRWGLNLSYNDSMNFMMNITNYFDSRPGGISAPYKVGDSYVVELSFYGFDEVIQVEFNVDKNGDPVVEDMLLVE